MPGIYVLKRYVSMQIKTPHQIFNLAGLMLANYSYEIDEGYNKLNINAGDLHPGMYQLILTVGGSRQISKLVVH
ncbi:MAG: hypothetical protein Kow0027_24410 [Saprospiraceae bacterium]